VNSIAEIFAEEQFWVRDTLTRVAHEGIGDLAIPGVVPRLSETPGRIERLGGALGENNSQVFRDWLDIGDSELAELQKAGVI
jgi:crotonobetainyl-CoA:carnitine CoA-transferase CaiB-like acyl-CoA transferase